MTDNAAAALQFDVNYDGTAITVANFQDEFCPVRVCFDQVMLHRPFRQVDTLFDQSSGLWGLAGRKGYFSNTADPSSVLSDAVYDVSTGTLTTAAAGDEIFVELKLTLNSTISSTSRVPHLLGYRQRMPMLSNSRAQ